MTDSSLVVSAPVESPTSVREARADRFLARVAALSPREWGELDAIGQRFKGPDPIALWDRARRMASFAAQVPVLDDVVTVVGFVGLGIGGMIERLIGSGDRSVRPKLPVRRDLPPEARSFFGRIESLWDLADMQPGGRGASSDILTYALFAVWARDLTPAPAFERMYSLVEPVIPAASLD